MVLISHFNLMTFPSPSNTGLTKYSTCQVTSYQNWPVPSGHVWPWPVSSCLKWRTFTATGKCCLEVKGN